VLCPTGQEHIGLLQTDAAKLADRRAVVPVALQERSALKKEEVWSTEGQGRESTVSAVSGGINLTPAEVINAAPSASERLELLKPITWIHAPKTGTSMVNLFYSHPNICPLVPKGIKMPDNRDLPDRDLFAAYPPDLFCPGSFKYDRGLEIQACHGAAGSLYEDIKGHIVAMFRQPEQRLLSAYHDTVWRTSHSWNSTIREPRDALDFAEVMQGCETKMIARQTEFNDADSNPCFGPPSPPATEDESDLAVQRLREGFAFVGLTDEWDISVCLFHAKFGGDCHAIEFVDSRLGAGRGDTDSKHNTSELHGFEDKVDGRLFEEAVRIFDEDTSRFGVSASSCTEWCWFKGDF